MDKPRTKFCPPCSRKLRGNSFREHQTENGTVIAHADCKDIIEGGFNVVTVDDGESE